ncbi:MAG: hypothetical protein AB7S70_04605 [Hyphomicrobium sp.]|uniref:hypothetical protein n=1 Tax=Hyphomicrobium sp. TaxID=82 RepID=UPI003D13DC29
MQGKTGASALALVVLGLCILAYARPELAAWPWVAVAGGVLAGAVLLHAWQRRRSVLGGPLNIAVTTFVLTELLLPVLVAVAALAAWLTGSSGVLDAAIVLAVTLACVTWL